MPFLQSSHHQLDRGHHHPSGQEPPQIRSGRPVRKNGVVTGDRPEKQPVYTGTKSHGYQLRITKGSKKCKKGSSVRPTSHTGRSTSKSTTMMSLPSYRVLEGDFGMSLSNHVRQNNSRAGNQRHKSQAPPGRGRNQPMHLGH